MKIRSKRLLALLALALVVAGCTTPSPNDSQQPLVKVGEQMDEQSDRHAHQTLAEGRHTFRFDTFGDEAFWGDTLRLHEAIKGARLGGVGPGVSPKTALSVGLKVDADALPGKLVSDLKNGRVNLDALEFVEFQEGDNVGPAAQGVHLPNVLLARRSGQDDHRQMSRPGNRRQPGLPGSLSCS